jgi:predicted RNase H-like HicB family nuclease
MLKRYTAVITKEENWYVSRCMELGVVSQGKTIAEAQANLKEAVELYVESFGVPSRSQVALGNKNGCQAELGLQ